MLFTSATGLPDNPANIPLLQSHPNPPSYGVSCLTCKLSHPPPLSFLTHSLCRTFTQMISSTYSCFSCNLVIETFQLKLSNEMFSDSVSPVLVSTVMAERHNDSGNYDWKKCFVYSVFVTWLRCNYNYFIPISSLRGVSTIKC